MKAEEFAVLMPHISSDFVRVIVEKRGISEQEAILKLYTSKLYAMLEREETKVWHYSTPMLYSLLEQEEKTGDIVFPDV